LIFNEVRGAILAVPVLYGMYQAGGSWMAIWVGFCSLVGIALSVVLPLIAAKKIQKFADEKLPKPVPVNA
jgi:fumarate reductase subunit D